MIPISAVLSSAIEKVTHITEIAGDKFKDVCPDFLKPEPTEVPTHQIEAAAHSACHFFGMPDIPMQEGDNIGVYTLNPDITNDDVFQYNVDQFKDMGLTSFEDQTKVWTHECGHRITQKAFGNTTWADELGADFLVGVREEMVGMGKSNFDQFLGKTKASQGHPGGALRLKAVEYGRKVAADMKRNSITPNWQNCLDAFSKSDFSKITYEKNNLITFSESNAKVNDLHPQLQKEMKGFTMEDVNWYDHQAHISTGAEKTHWVREAKWARNHLQSIAENETTNINQNMLNNSLKEFYSQADIEWYEEQARTSSGSEQSHWAHDAAWAKRHQKNYVIVPESESPYLKIGVPLQNNLILFPEAKSPNLEMGLKIHNNLFITSESKTPYIKMGFMI